MKPEGAWYVTATEDLSTTTTTSAAATTMIKTHSTSIAFPPPLPQRLGQRDPAASASAWGCLRVLLVMVVVFHLLLSVGGFLYLYTRGTVFIVFIY